MNNLGPVCIHQPKCPYPISGGMKTDAHDKADPNVRIRPAVTSDSIMFTTLYLLKQDSTH